MGVAARLIAAAALLCLCSTAAGRSLKQVGLWGQGAGKPGHASAAAAATAAAAAPPAARPPTRRRCGANSNPLLPSSLLQDPSAKIWSNYTLERATFYMSLQMKLPAPKTDSAEKCAEVGAVMRAGMHSIQYACSNMRLYLVAVLISCRMTLLHLPHRPAGVPRR